MTTKKTRRRARRGFGEIQQRSSGRYGARYIGPDGARHSATKTPQRPRGTFATRAEAEAFLAAEQRSIELGTWVAPAKREAQAALNGMTVAELIDRWLGSGRHKTSAAQSHRRKMEGRVLCPSTETFTSLRDVRVVDVDRQRVRQWWAEVKATWPNAANENAMSYRRLHTAFEYAIDELELIDTNPVNIKGAGATPRPKVQDRPVIELAEAAALIDAFSERMRIAPGLLLWSGLRIGELLELRRKDLIGLMDSGPVTVRVRRNAQRVRNMQTGRYYMEPNETPKTEASNRDIELPPDVAAAIREHAQRFMAEGPDALVITTKNGQQMMDTSFREWHFNPARAAAGRPDITPHDCRRFYGTRLINLVASGAISFDEARKLMGHTTTSQLMEYARSASGYGGRAATGLAKLMQGEMDK